MLLDDIADYLTSGSVATGGTNLFGGVLPTSPPTCGALYEIPGLAPVRGMGNTAGDAAVEKPGLKVVFRSTDYKVARLLAHRAWKLLDGMPVRTINGVRYSWCQSRQPPWGPGRDENGLPTCECNYDIVKDPSTTS